MARMDAGLLAQARVRPEQIALRCDDESRTYAELDDRARRVSHALHALGVRRGDRVARAASAPSRACSDARYRPCLNRLRGSLRDMR